MRVAWLLPLVGLACSATFDPKDGGATGTTANFPGGGGTGSDDGGTGGTTDNGGSVRARGRDRMESPKEALQTSTTLKWR